jgi:hypothetical protein
MNSWRNALALFRPTQPAVKHFKQEEHALPIFELSPATARTGSSKTPRSRPSPAICAARCCARTKPATTPRAGFGTA